MNDSFGIEDKVAIVTGSNRGIGKAIVEQFMSCGAKKVYAAVRTPGTESQLVERFGDRVVPVEIDLERPETIVAAAEMAVDVEVLVNNAGVLSNSSPVADNAVDSLKSEMEINVFGLMRMAQAFSPILKRNGGGAIVQINSIASMKSFYRFSTYCASKAAAYSITQALRDVLSEQKTRVISVHPGPIGTDMAVTAGIEDVAEPVSVVAERVVEALKDSSFHVFPDMLAERIGNEYRGFSDNIIEEELL